MVCEHSKYFTENLGLIDLSKNVNILIIVRPKLILLYFPTYHVTGIFAIYHRPENTTPGNKSSKKILFTITAKINKMVKQILENTK